MCSGETREGPHSAVKMYSDGLRKFLVLQWKSLLQKKRHWILTLLEIVIPSILFIAVVVLRYQAEEFSPKQIEAEERTVENFGKAEGEEHSKRIVLKGAFTFDAQFSIRWQNFRRERPQNRTNMYANISRP